MTSDEPRTAPERRRPRQCVSREAHPCKLGRGSLFGLRNVSHMLDLESVQVPPAFLLVGVIDLAGLGAAGR